MSTIGEFSFEKLCPESQKGPEMNVTESKVLCNIFSKCTINIFQHLTKVKYLF